MAETKSRGLTCTDFVAIAVIHDRMRRNKIVPRPRRPKHGRLVSLIWDIPDQLDVATLGKSATETLLYRYAEQQDVLQEFRHEPLLSSEEQVNSILPLRRPRSADRTEARNYNFLKPLLQRARDSSFVNTGTSSCSDSCSSYTISDVLSGIWFSAKTPKSPTSRNINTVVLARPDSSMENLLAIKSDLEELDLSIDERIWMSIFKAKSTTDLRRHTSVLIMKKSRSLCGLSDYSLTTHHSTDRLSNVSSYQNDFEESSLSYDSKSSSKELGKEIQWDDFNLRNVVDHLPRLDRLSSDIYNNPKFRSDDYEYGPTELTYDIYDEIDSDIRAFAKRQRYIERYGHEQPLRDRAMLQRRQLERARSRSRSARRQRKQAARKRRQKDESARREHPRRSTGNIFSRVMRFFRSSRKVHPTQEAHRHGKAENQFEPQNQIEDSRKGGRRMRSRKVRPAQECEQQQLSQSEPSRFKRLLCCFGIGSGQVDVVERQ